jgi:biopolymer transport protein ExbD
MTSLIDLTFLLLVTFIITMPALEQGISIILPRAKTDTLPTKDNKATTITVDAANKIYLNNVPTSLDALEQDLLAKVAADPEVPVLVRGDERLTYGSVMDVVKLVYKCKVHRMALVTVEN